MQDLNSALLYYHISTDGSYVLAITNNTMDVIRLPVDAPEIGNAVDSLLVPFHTIQNLGMDSPAFRSHIAYQLYQWLIQPVVDQMPLPENLVIIRDAPLYNLPFDMLLTRKTSRACYYPPDIPDYSDDFLLHTYSISYSPSAYFLIVGPEKTRNNSILVLANPTADEHQNSAARQRLRSQFDWVFGSLPFLGTGITVNRDLFSRQRVLKRESATENAVNKRAPHADILHFATHAFADTVYEAFSGVLLARTDSTSDDGILMGYEIETLPLNCDLVTLSACETGSGQSGAR
ncbi:MAG: CHAT domain-containing protein [candidate division KSB1 bacterium]|nr:CHAT domain-containing protein [candidate division KSB1 bacterium]